LKKKLFSSISSWHCEILFLFFKKLWFFLVHFFGVSDLSFFFWEFSFTELGFTKFIFFRVPVLEFGYWGSGFLESSGQFCGGRRFGGLRLGRSRTSGSGIAGHRVQVLEQQRQPVFRGLVILQAGNTKQKKL
jgi:hypothetical protein